VRKNRKLEHARQSAARASYVGLLASGLAHEIRNPLNAMNMNVQMLEEELQGVPGIEHEEFGDLLDSTKSEIKRLERLVNNFLAYARPAKPRFEAMDMNVVVREVLRFLELDFRQSKVELKTDLEPLLPAVEIDETQFKQALMNLLVNARQVLINGGNVSVATRAGTRGDVVLEIEDDGPGIPTEIRERIFEVFYSSRGGGTGLGLPIARQIIEKHGGTIELDSEEGRGTRFTIHLPRHHARFVATPHPTEPER
jgi:signal transduction histidine kinase